MAKRSSKITATMTPAQLSAAAERRAEGKVQALFPDRA